MSFRSCERRIGIVSCWAHSLVSMCPMASCDRKWVTAIDLWLLTYIRPAEPGKKRSKRRREHKCNRNINYWLLGASERVKLSTSDTLISSWCVIEHDVRVSRDQFTSNEEPELCESIRKKYIIQPAIQQSASNKRKQTTANVIWELSRLFSQTLSWKSR